MTARRSQKHAGLIDELRKTVGVDPPTSAAVSRKLRRLLERPGVPEALLEVLLYADLADAHLAAFPLSLAQGELLRRRLLRDLKTLEPERQKAALAALRAEERERFLEPKQELIDDALVQASSMLAANSPEKFYEMLVAARVPLNEELVAKIEPVRHSLGLGAVFVYEPLLLRQLSPEGRRAVIKLLGREPSAQAAALLEKEAKKARSPEEERDLRRERLRQGTIAIGPTPAPQGSAFLSALQEDGSYRLEIFHQPKQGKVIQESQLIAPSGRVERSTKPTSKTLDELEHAVGEGWVPMQLGQARFLLERLPQRWAGAIAPTLERLSSVEVEGFAPPPPTSQPSAETIEELVRHPVFAHWDPVQSVARVLVEHFLVVAGPSSTGKPGASDADPFGELEHQALDAALPSVGALHRQNPNPPPPESKSSLPSAELLDDSQDEFFPISKSQLDSLARQALESARRRQGGIRQLERGLRHAATFLNLSQDPRASQVSFEAHRVGAELGSQKLLLALARRKVWQQLWKQAEFPEAYRRRLRRLARQSLGHSTPSWDEVRELDLCQAALEGLARDQGQAASEPGLPEPDSLDLELAARLARWARKELGELFARKRLGPSRISKASEALSTAFPAVPGTTLLAVQSSLLQLRDEACQGLCPYRCWNGEEKDIPGNPQVAHALPDLPHEDRPEQGLQLQITESWDTSGKGKSG